MRHPTLARAKEVAENPPYLKLELRLNKSKNRSNGVNNVLHWFRNQDLRVEDNKSLNAATKLAHQNQKTSRVISLYTAVPQELKAHGIGAARRDFMTRGLKIIQDQLQEKFSIPLVNLTTTVKKQPEAIIEFAKKNNVSHIFANYEYEHDEVIRDLAVLEAAENAGIEFKLFHDQTVVQPGRVLTASGVPLKVFTPFHDKWIRIISGNPKLYEVLPDPESNPDKEGIAELFSSETVDLNANGDSKPPSQELQQHWEELWPAGNEAAVDRLRKFLKEKIKRYGDERSTPALDNCSRLSAYFATGMLSPRQALYITRREANNDRAFGVSGSGVNAWVRELAFRELYRQLVAIVYPQIIMNMPQNLNFSEIKYEWDEEGWNRWCEGTLGIPFVDAGMRQLKAEAFMHNRLRMNVASYLRLNLFIDYRKGEEFFANHLVDYDPCNNSWGWQPNYTSFNPVLQAEKCDPDGDYIRRWVPELADVEAPAIFEPYKRLSKEAFKKLGYPEPYVKDFHKSKTRATESMKEATAKAKEKTAALSKSKRIKREE